TDQGFVQITQGKSKAARRVLPMVPAVQSILEQRHNQQGYPSDGWIFPSSSKSGHIGQGLAKRQHRRALERAGGKAFVPYSLRHTALTNLASECDTFALKTIDGHSSITMTQRYVHPQAQAIAEAFSSLRNRQGSVTQSVTCPVEKLERPSNDNVLSTKESVG